jgi:hypothetical protein
LSTLLTILFGAVRRNLKLDLTAVAFVGLGALLATSVLTLEDFRHEGDTLATFLW